MMINVTAHSGPAAQAVFQAITRIARWSNRPETRDLLLGPIGHELSNGDVNLLRTIAANGPIRISDLAHWQGVDKSTMTMQVRRLEQRLLVRRRPDPTDQRAVLLTTTTKGHRVFERMNAAGADVVAVVLQDWPERDRKLFATLIARFADIVDKPAG